MEDQRLWPALCEQSGIVRGAQRGITRNRDCADTNRAEVRCDKFRAVWQDKQHTVAALYSEPDQAIARAVHQIKNIEIGQPPSFVCDRGSAASPLRYMAVDEMMC